MKLLGKAETLSSEGWKRRKSREMPLTTGKKAESQTQQQKDSLCYNSQICIHFPELERDPHGSLGPSNIWLFTGESQKNPILYSRVFQTFLADLHLPRQILSFNRAGQSLETPPPPGPMQCFPILGNTPSLSISQAPSCSPH